jgi:hypothetical protein
MRVKLVDIVFGAGTQVRAAINDQLVTDYAERMAEGVVFPAIVLFHDGNAHYLADGFHRFLAAQRNQFPDIDSDVHAGTKEDALWFALGANRANGQRMTLLDKQHAVAIALNTWPNKMQREIAEQVGCHPSLVSEVYRKSTGSEPVLRGRALQTKEKRDRVRDLIAGSNMGAESIAREAKVSRTLVTDVRVEMGLSRVSTKPVDVLARRERMRDMAADGYTSRQIASEIGLDVSTVGRIAKEHGIDVPADRVVGKTTKKHDSNRIVQRMVMDAENLCADVNLIQFADLDRSQIAHWVQSLNESRDQLGGFIRRLMKEHKNHGEAA